MNTYIAIGISKGIITAHGSASDVGSRFRSHQIFPAQDSHAACSLFF